MVKRCIRVVHCPVTDAVRGHYSCLIDIILIEDGMLFCFEYCLSCYFMYLLFTIQKQRSPGASTRCNCPVLILASSQSFH